MPGLSEDYKLSKRHSLSAQAASQFDDDHTSSAAVPKVLRVDSFIPFADGPGNDKTTAPLPPAPVQAVPQHMSDHVVPSRLGNFTLLAEHQLELPPFTKIAKWQSQKTGMKVIWADTPGPVANFWATVNTEIFNSSGEPHTLEHLTFTSSEHHPYSGILDALANRMFTQGTNAWTAVDNTTYTVDSCSEEGLLAIIPVFLDHVLFPLFTPDIFKTEIFHVDGEGEEGGVVFSEMQGREGSQGDVMERALCDVLYNAKNGYLSETGGQLDALRKLKLEQIEDYHSHAYAPNNITIVVCGQSIHPEKLLDTLNSTVERTLAKAGKALGPHPRGWIRPFVESSTARNPPVLQRDVVKTVEYADSDESVGAIQISWIGPHSDDFLTTAALGALGSYLSGSSTSPLSKMFVEIADPACSGIGFSSEYRDPTILHVDIVSVPAHRLPSLGAELLDALREILRQDFDMDRMWTVLDQQILSMKETLESSPAAYVQGSVAQEILYGAEDGSTFIKYFQDRKLIKKLLKFTADDWLDLLETWFVERHSVMLIGTPSADLAKKQSTATASRNAATKKRLGPSGLSKLAADLDAAKKANDHPAPAKVIESYKIPDVRGIAWLEVETARSNGVGMGKTKFRTELQDKINADKGGELPYFVQFDSFDSSFVSVSALLHGPPTSIFPLFLDTFFAMPVERADGSHLTFEEANHLLDKEAIGFSAQTLGEGILVSIKMVKEDYNKAITWLSDTLYGTKYDVDRLRHLVNTSLQNLPDEKEDGAGLAQSAVDSMIFGTGSYNAPTNVISRAKLYPTLRQRLQKDPQGIIKELEAMRSSMLDPRALRLKVTGDVLSLKKPVSAWLDHFERIPPFPAQQLAPVIRTRNLLTSLGRSPAKKGVLYTLSSSESTYLLTRARCPDHEHPDFSAIALAGTCLSATNSFLWNAVRGPGLAYGAYVTADAESGVLGFLAFKSPDAFAAFAAAQKIVSSIAKGETPIKQSDVDAARSQIVFGKVSSLASLLDAANASFVDSVLFNRPPKYAQRTLERLKHVTPADVQRVIKKYILPAFDPQTSIFGATTSEGKRDELVKNFTKLGYVVEQRKF
ncbi:hypothetical protein JCM11641_002994 [Rhodosporidiobolus odoratus]